VLAAPRIPWQKKLARVTRNAVQFAMGAVDHKYDAPSRRQAGIGYGSGKPILPRLRRPLVKVDIAIDTSGSMSQHDLADALREAKGILRHAGCAVRAIICDAEVHDVGEVHDVRALARMLKGGGGTDFNPVFEAVRTGKRRPNILVFATDGCGPAPATPPPGVHVIWLLIGSYKSRPTTWGEYIEVE
jgi:predicted metal-dependent peptidase